MRNSKPHFDTGWEPGVVHFRTEHQIPMLLIASSVPAPVDVCPGSIVEHIAAPAFCADTQFCSSGRALPRHAVPCQRGRPQRVPKSSSWKCVCQGEFGQGQDHLSPRQLLVLQTHMGFCSVHQSKNTPTPAVKCIPLVTCSNVLQQPTEQCLSLRTCSSQCHRGGLHCRHPRRGVLGEAAKFFLSGGSSQPPRCCGATWRFAEAKTI